MLFFFLCFFIFQFFIIILPSLIDVVSLIFFTDFQSFLFWFCWLIHPRIWFIIFFYDFLHLIFCSFVYVLYWVEFFKSYSVIYVSVIQCVFHIYISFFFVDILLFFCFQLYTSNVNHYGISFILYFFVFSTIISIF